MKKSFPVAFTEAIQLANALSQDFVTNVPEDEVAFLAVHIQAMKEQKEENIKRKSVSYLFVVVAKAPHNSWLPDFVEIMKRSRFLGYFQSKS